MANEGEFRLVSNDHEPPLVKSDALESKVTSGDYDNDLRVLDGVVRELPPHVVKDLLSIGVCIPCMFRLFGIKGDIYSFSSGLSPVSSCIQEPTDRDNGKHTYTTPISKEIEAEPPICCLCLGILQFTYNDEKDKVVKYERAAELAMSISEMVKQAGYQIDTFSLEVSVPAVIVENDQIIRLYLKTKYGSEPWFEENSLSLCLSAKDALKIAIAKPLETLLDCKSTSISDFRIRLTYSSTKASNGVTCSREWNQGCKRRKTDSDYSLDAVDDSIAANISRSEVDAVVEGRFNSSRDNETAGCFKLLPKINEPCNLAFQFYRKPIYFIGRYLKYSRNVSQTRWIIDDERMGETSVEEILGSNILPLCCGDNYKFHAAGREDIDVRMLGSGRPFLVEIQNARHLPSEMVVKEMETKINNFENKLVGVKNLKVVGSEGWTLMREGEAEKQKQYAALVWISRPLEDKDLNSISLVKDMKIVQRTPIRVLHRRSPLAREKIVHWMKIEKVSGTSQYFLLHLCTQAGTYIKEFVHGDLGRTHPSVGSILGCRAEILQLDVTDVKMDRYPE